MCLMLKDERLFPSGSCATRAENWVVAVAADAGVHNGWYGVFIVENMEG